MSASSLSSLATGKFTDPLSPVNAFVGFYDARGLNGDIIEQCGKTTRRGVFHSASSLGKWKIFIWNEHHRVIFSGSNYLHYTNISGFKQIKHFI